MTMIRGLSTIIAVAMILSTAFSQNNCCQFQIGNNILGEDEFDLSGSRISLSADGKTVAIAASLNDGNGDASGHVRIHTFDTQSSQWIQKGSDIDGEAMRDYSGSSISLSSDGNTIAIGAPSNNGSGQAAGHVRIYTYNDLSMNWAQKGSDIDGEASGDQSGIAVSLSSDGNTIAIGAPINHGSEQAAGHVRIYTYNDLSMTWSQKGNDIDGEASSDQSGATVSLSSDGSTVAIGSRFNQENGFEAGHVRIFFFNEQTLSWVQKGNDLNGDAIDGLGSFISLSTNGNTIAAGATGPFGSDSYTRIFYWDPQTMSWIQKGNDIDAVNYYDTQNDIDLSADGHTIVIGSNGGNNLATGLVRIFTYDLQSMIWIQKGNDREGMIGDSGASVSISSDGKITAIGTPGNDENGSQAGLVQIYSTSDLNAFSPNLPAIENSFVGLDGTYRGGSISSANNNCPSGSTLHYAVDDGVYAKEVPTYNQTIAQDIGTICICDLDENVKSETSVITTIPGSSPASVIPTLGEWGVSILATLLMIFGVLSYHQRIEMAKV